jgi:hypothetical protein
MMRVVRSLNIAPSSSSSRQCTPPSTPFHYSFEIAPTTLCVRGSVVHEVDLSCKDIEGAFKRIAQLSSRGDRSPPAGTVTSDLRVKISRQWYKLEWCFLKRGDVLDFQSKLKASTQRLTALLVILNQCVFAFEQQGSS